MHMISLRPRSDIHMCTPSKLFIFKLYRSLLPLSMKYYLKRTDLCIVQGTANKHYRCTTSRSPFHATCIIIMMYDLLNSSLQEHT